MKQPDGKWWTQTFNPVTGCTPVSAGCKNCWAKRMHDRKLWGGGAKPFSEIQLHPERLGQPLHWHKRRRVAVCLMGDLFHPDVPNRDDLPDESLVEIFWVMYRTPQHFYFVLTKRAERMAEFTRRNPLGIPEGYLPNVALGTSVEDQATADERIPHLLKCPAALLFVSVEPMLAPVNLECVSSGPIRCDGRVIAESVHVNALDNRMEQRISWCIVGSESGPGARPMELDWVRSIRDQCETAGTSLFFKQMLVKGKRVNMPPLDGVVHDKMPEVTVPPRSEM